MDDNSITVSLCGDVLLTKRMPQSYLDNSPLTTFLRQHDCRFGNLETTIHNGEGIPELFPGGGYAMANSACLKDLKAFGFNVFNTANNHSMDYGHSGLLATLYYLDEECLLHAGTGKNLNDAAKPAYLETLNGRVAVLGVTSSFHDSYAAGPQNQDMLGRPGVAPLKHRSLYELSPEYFDALLSISEVSGINAHRNQAKKWGYATEDETMKFGIYEFKKSINNIVHTTPNERDTERTLKYVRDARRQADLVILSIHSHHFRHNSPIGNSETAEYSRLFAQKCIDAGTDIVVCHGPHVTRGVEIYKSGIIFHGLGNFIFEHEHMEVLPEEYYWNYGKTREDCDGVGELMYIRDDGGKKGLATVKEAWESIIVSLDYSPKRILVKMYPVEIMRSKMIGLPCFSNSIDALNRIKTLSESYGTRLSIDASRKMASFIIQR